MVRRRAGALFLALALWAASPGAAPQSPSLRDRGYDAVYNLDYDRAADLFHQAIAADPNDAAAYRGAAKTAWLRILFEWGVVTADEYLGKMSSTDVKRPAPPAHLDAEFHNNIDRAVQLGETAVARQPNSASAHYDLGAAHGFIASYMGTIDGKMFGAMRAARHAFSEHEKVLSIDPLRHDAGLVVGTYRYIVAALPMPLRWMAYMAGFGGGRETAIRRLEEAAAYPSDAQADARFALVLIYNRERRYDEALAVVRTLQRSFPRNRLLWLEEGGTALRAKRPQEAERALASGLQRMEQDTRPRMPGEAGQLYCKRGAARLMMKNLPGAEQDLRASLADRTASTWVRGRAHTEMGKLADIAGDRKRARSEYQTAAALCGQSNDELGAEEAKALLDKAYKQ